MNDAIVIAKRAIMLSADMNLSFTWANEHCSYIGLMWVYTAHLDSISGLFSAHTDLLPKITDLGSICCRPYKPSIYCSPYKSYHSVHKVTFSALWGMEAMLCSRLVGSLESLYHKNVRGFEACKLEQGMKVFGYHYSVVGMLCEEKDS